MKVHVKVAYRYYSKRKLIDLLEDRDALIKHLQSELAVSNQERNDNMEFTRMVEIFERIKRNCLFYEKEGKKLALLNEIGALRGVAYCMVEDGNVNDDEFIRLIGIQQELKAQEG